MEKFCVISASAIGRTFAETKEKAAEHGKGLLEREFFRNQKPNRMFIVQVVGVIEVGVPEMKMREPADSDFGIHRVVGRDLDDDDLPDDEFAAKTSGRGKPRP